MGTENVPIKIGMMNHKNCPSKQPFLLTSVNNIGSFLSDGEIVPGVGRNAAKNQTHLVGMAFF